MHRTTINFPEELFQQAKQKAETEGTTISQVLRQLLTHWLRPEASVEESHDSSQAIVEKALSTYGMWQDRDPDQFLRDSRAQLKDRDREVNDAQALEAFHLLCRTEGIIPALESSHAVSAAVQLAGNLPPDQIVLVCLSGRGDKDIDIVAQASGLLAFLD